MFENQSVLCVKCHQTIPQLFRDTLKVNPIVSEVTKFKPHVPFIATKACHACSELRPKEKDDDSRIFQHDGNGFGEKIALVWMRQAQQEVFQYFMCT